MKNIKKLIVIALAATMLLGATITVSASRNCPACGYPNMINYDGNRWICTRCGHRI